MEKTITYNELMENETVKKSTDEVLSAIEKDAEAMKLIEAASTVEDMYEATKRYLKIAFEDFKKFFACTVEYFTSQKAVLNDEMLDNVVGGWSISGFFNSISEKAKCIACVVVGAAVCVAGGALALTSIALGGPVGAAIGGLAGTAVVGYGYTMICIGGEDLFFNKV